MHKFFCNYNNITEKYELSQNKTNIFNVRINSDEENDLMKQLQSKMQNLYNLISQIKDQYNNDENIELINETELLLSNLYYSFFASPLELPNEEKEKTELKVLLTKAIEEATSITKIINIPEYNRLIVIITNNLQTLLNRF